MIDVAVMASSTWRHVGSPPLTLEPPSCVSLGGHYPTLDDRIPSHEDLSTILVLSAFILLNMTVPTRSFSCLCILVVVTPICLDKVPGCLGTARDLTNNTFTLTWAGRQCQDCLVSAFLFSILASRSLLPDLNLFSSV